MNQPRMNLQEWLQIRPVNRESVDWLKAKLVDDLGPSEIEPQREDPPKQDPSRTLKQDPERY